MVKDGNRCNTTGDNKKPTTEIPMKPKTENDQNTKTDMTNVCSKPKETQGILYEMLWSEKIFIKIFSFLCNFRYKPTGQKRRITLRIIEDINSFATGS